MYVFTMLLLLLLLRSFIPGRSIDRFRLSLLLNSTLRRPWIILPWRDQINKKAGAETPETPTCGLIHVPDMLTFLITDSITGSTWIEFLTCYAGAGGADRLLPVRRHRGDSCRCTYRELTNGTVERRARPERIEFGR